MSKQKPKTQTNRNHLSGFAFRSGFGAGRGLPEDFASSNNSAPRVGFCQLEKRVAELEERLNLNSNNSSKPPSSDRKKNKQKPKDKAVHGHPGHHRKLSEKFDKRIVVKLKQCQYCGSKDLQSKPPCITQQIEIPDNDLLCN